MDTKRAVLAGVVAALVVGAAVGALTGQTPQSGQTPISTDQTPTVVLSSSSATNVDLTDYAQGATLDVETELGNITISGDAGATATLATSDIEGAKTQITGASLGSSWLNLNPADKQRVDVRGDADSLAFESITADDGATDIQIGGTQGGTAELRLWDLQADTTYALYDGSPDETLGHFTTNSSGVGQTTVGLPDGSQTIRVRTAGDIPAPNASNPQPTDTVTTRPDTLSVDVTAEAWPTTVEFYLGGSSVGTATLSSNGTVSTSVTVDRLGQHNWSAVATDDIGQRDTLNASFRTPSNITFRAEHDPPTTIDNVSVTARFFTVDGDIAIQRTTDNGSIDMAGLPDTEFVLFVESANHYDRRVYIDDIYEQNNVYLLNETAFPRSNNSAIRSRFVYEDLTGELPRDKTTIQIQRALDLNDNGTSEYRTIAGDYWGASNEFEAILEYGERYRIKLVNRETGEETIQGAHVPTADLTQTVRVSGLVEEAKNASGVVSLAELNKSAQTINIAYRDPADETDSLAVEVVARGGDRVLYNDSINSTLGSYGTTIQLNDSEAKQDWTVVFDGGDRHRSAIPVGSGTIGLPVAVPSWLLTILMAMTVTFVGGLYGPRTALLGAWAMVFVAGGAAMFGWAFGGPSVVVAALTVAAATFVARSLP